MYLKLRYFIHHLINSRKRIINNVMIWFAFRYMFDLNLTSEQSSVYSIMKAYASLVVSTGVSAD